MLYFLLYNLSIDCDHFGCSNSNLKHSRFQLILLKDARSRHRLGIRYTPYLFSGTRKSTHTHSLLVYGVGIQALWKSSEAMTSFHLRPIANMAFKHWDVLLFVFFFVCFMRLGIKPTVLLILGQPCTWNLWCSEAESCYVAQAAPEFTVNSG